MGEFRALVTFDRIFIKETHGNPPYAFGLGHSVDVQHGSG
jgi:hypothetical protein